MGSNEVIISGVHVDLTDSIKSAVNNKVRKLFSHSGSIIRVNVTLQAQKNKSRMDEFIANGKIEIGGPDIQATATTGDLYKSIDDMVDKLDRQLKNQSKKTDRNFRKSIKSIER